VGVRPTSMPSPTRFQLLLGAILLSGALVLWPFMRRMRAIDVCLSAGNVYDYSAHRCVAPVNPHPSVSDTATARIKPRIVPAH
jgi:hypothetical protein